MIDVSAVATHALSAGAGAFASWLVQRYLKHRGQITFRVDKWNIRFLGGPNTLNELVPCDPRNAIRAEPSLDGAFWSNKDARSGLQRIRLEFRHGRTPVLTYQPLDREQAYQFAGGLRTPPMTELNLPSREWVPVKLKVIIGDQPNTSKLLNCDSVWLIGYTPENKEHKFQLSTLDFTSPQTGNE